MKIKSDFITNSSSASFLVAIKKDTPTSHLLTLFKPSVDTYFADLVKYGAEYELNFWAKRLSDEELTAENLLPIIVYEFMNLFNRRPVELDSWKAITRYFTNEDSEGIGNFMYSYLNIKNDDFVKIASDD